MLEILLKKKLHKLGKPYLLGLVVYSLKLVGKRKKRRKIFSIRKQKKRFKRMIVMRLFMIMLFILMMQLWIIMKRERDNDNKNFM